MSGRAMEVAKFHTRLQKCTLEIENSRAYWSHINPGEKPSTSAAYEGYWFGAKSSPRVEMLVQHLTWRFGIIEQVQKALKLCCDLDADTRRLICHWHLQFSDPLYRRFTGEFLPMRIEQQRSEFTKDVVVSWIETMTPGKWQVRTQMKFATNLIRASREAGLTESMRDPRRARECVTTDRALTYLIHFLRDADFDGSLLGNPYLRSVGLEGARLEKRLKSLSSVAFRKQGALFDFGWRYDSLLDWAESELVEEAVSEAS